MSGREEWLVVGAAADQYGADAMLRYVVAHLSRLGHRPEVVLPEPGPLCERFAESGQPCAVVDTLVLRKSLRDPRVLARELTRVPSRVLGHARTLRQGQANVYVNTVTVPLWPLAARVARRRVVIHVHEILGGRSRASGVARWVLYLQLFLARTVVCVSDAVRADVEAAHPALARRCVTLLNASFASPVADGRRDDPAPATRTDFVVVGRLSPRKGQHVVLEALRHLDPADRPSVTFAGTCFRGYEWYQRQLAEEIERHGLPVEMVGYLPTEEAFGRAAASIVPSTVPDPAPLVVLEALALGKVVVAARCGGIPELLGRAGRLFEPGDPAGLAERLLEVGRATPEQRRAWQESAVERARELSPDRYWARFDTAVLHA